MGSEHSKFKKNSKYSDFFESKKKYKNRLSEGSTRCNSNLLTDLNKEKDTQNNNLIKSQTEVKISKTEKENDIEKEEEEEEKVSKKKERKKTMDGLKSLSSQNLVKIEVKSDSENASSNNINIVQKNNDSNDKNNNPSKELYEDVDNDNSIEDDSEGDEAHENVKEETEEEKKMVPNNIKKVFIDSRAINNKTKENKDKEKEKEDLSLTEENNNKNINSNNNSSSNVITANDLELNFYRNGTDIRQSYLTKLIQTKVWTPNLKPKKHNCIIIFDWDDTLLPTSFLTKGGNFYEEMELSPSEQKKMNEIQDLVLELLTETTEKGTVYIITNAGKGWVEYSANKFYPKIIPVLDKVKIVSARGEYEDIYPGNSRQWKIEAFLMIPNTVNISIVTNIICLGDSLFEMEAGRILASRFTEAFIKTIKFRETPKLDELIKQLKLVCKQFNSIYSSIKNLTIRVERKKK